MDQQNLLTFMPQLLLLLCLCIRFAYKSTVLLLNKFNYFLIISCMDTMEYNHLTTFSFSNILMLTSTYFPKLSFFYNTLCPVSIVHVCGAIHLWVVNRSHPPTNHDSIFSANLIKGWDLHGPNTAGGCIDDIVPSVTTEGQANVLGLFLYLKSC